MSQPPYIPGPPPGGPHPPQYYGPPPTKKKNKIGLILAIVGGVLALCCVGTVAIGLAGGDKGNEAAGAADPPAAEQPAAPGDPTKPAAKEAPAKRAAGIGDAVRDGKFEFTVTDMSCGKKTVGNEFLNKKAQGQFCLVDVTVRNIGDESQLFTGGSQKAFDAKGTEFSNDGAAEMYANDQSQTFLEEINPGNQVKGKLIFDVPESTTLTLLELHDSPFSGGVKVSLS